MKEIIMHLSKSIDELIQAGKKAKKSGNMELFHSITSQYYKLTQTANELAKSIIENAEPNEFPERKLDAFRKGYLNAYQVII